jgi:hypothetical protein
MSSEEVQFLKGELAKAITIIQRELGITDVNLDELLK